MSSKVVTEDSASKRLWPTSEGEPSLHVPLRAPADIRQSLSAIQFFTDRAAPSEYFFYKIKLIFGKDHPPEGATSIIYFQTYYKLTSFITRLPVGRGLAASVWLVSTNINYKYQRKVPSSTTSLGRRQRPHSQPSPPPTFSSILNIVKKRLTSLFFFSPPLVAVPRCDCQLL